MEPLWNILEQGWGDIQPSGPDAAPAPPAAAAPAAAASPAAPAPLAIEDRPDDGYNPYDGENGLDHVDDGEDEEEDEAACLDSLVMEDVEMGDANTLNDGAGGDDHAGEGGDDHAGEEGDEDDVPTTQPEQTPEDDQEFEPNIIDKDKNLVMALDEGLAHKHAFRPLPTPVRIPDEEDDADAVFKIESCSKYWGSKYSEGDTGRFSPEPSPAPSSSVAMGPPAAPAPGHASRKKEIMERMAALRHDSFLGRD